MIHNNINIENARIMNRNFAGKEIAPYNPAGVRNFCVFIDNELAEKLTDDGWNIKWTKPDEDNEQQAYLPVTVRFDNIPPKITIITSAGQKLLNEDTVFMLDTADIETIDMIIRPYNWSLPSGMNGVKAYLKSMYVTLAEDEFDKKYAHIPNYDM